MAVTPRSWAALAWHVLALSSCLYGFKSLELLPELLGASMEKQYGGFMQFFTMCGLVGTMITMSVALVLDLVEGPEALLWLKDLLMAASLPTETMITMLYWSIILIDKDLLVQPRKIMDPSNPGQVLREETVSVPFSIDASLHALPGVFLLVDFFLFSRPLPKSIPIVVVAAAVSIAYSLWAEKCAKMNGHFAYPLLDLMSGIQRTAFYAAAGALGCGTGLVVSRLQAKLTAPKREQQGGSGSSKKRR